MRISDWSSDVCSSDLLSRHTAFMPKLVTSCVCRRSLFRTMAGSTSRRTSMTTRTLSLRSDSSRTRSEEHTSELQSLMRISYAVFCLKKKIVLDLLYTQHYYNTTQIRHIYIKQD